MASACARSSCPSGFGGISVSTNAAPKCTPDATTAARTPSNAFPHCQCSPNRRQSKPEHFLPSIVNIGGLRVIAPTIISSASP